jgi:hypothetical protein
MAAVIDTKVSKDVSSLITIIIVTSPIESNPSTELLDRCLSSIIRAWPDLSHCHVVVAADGCQEDESVADSKRKRVFGKASAAQLRSYHAFLDRLDERPWMTVNRPSAIDNDHNAMSTEWLGFALTLQKAVETHVSTPLVFVTPHDYELEKDALKDIGVEQLAEAILLYEKGNNNITSQPHPINYIGLHNAKTLTLSQRNASVLENLPSIALQNSSTNFSTWTLTPLASWKENPHLASVTAYRDVVFGSGHHRFKRGHFIEDTLGQKMLQILKDSDVNTKQEIFKSFGTFLLDPPNNNNNDNKKKQPCTYHINGLKYIDTNERTSRGYAPPKDFEMERTQAAKEFVKRMNARSQKGCPK